MTKKQKLWLYISLALFALPELLWSPVGNFLYELSQTGRSGGTHPLRDNFLMDSSNADAYSIVLLVQFFGALAVAILLVLFRKQISRKWLLFLGLTFNIVLAVLVFILFGLSFALRSIGF